MSAAGAAVVVVESSSRMVVKAVRKVAVGVAGGALLAVGFVMLFLPAPGVATMMAGLGLLATEYAWARRWLVKSKTMVTSMHSRVRGHFGRPAKVAA